MSVFYVRRKFVQMFRCDCRYECTSFKVLGQDINIHPFLDHNRNTDSRCIHLNIDAMNVLNASFMMPGSSLVQFICSNACSRSSAILNAAVAAAAAADFTSLLLCACQITIYWSTVYNTIPGNSSCRHRLADWLDPW